MRCLIKSVSYHNIFEVKQLTKCSEMEDTRESEDNYQFDQAKGLFQLSWQTITDKVRSSQTTTKVFSALECHHACNCGLSQVEDQELLI